jgi:excisionase family DNA binding protein
MTFLTPAQIAQNYPVSRSALYAACRDGLLPYYRLPSRRGARGKYLIREADFLAWLERHRHGGEAVTPPPAGVPPTPPRPRPRLHHVRVRSP